MHDLVVDDSIYELLKLEILFSPNFYLWVTEVLASLTDCTPEWKT